MMEDDRTRFSVARTSDLASARETLETKGFAVVSDVLSKRNVSAVRAHLDRIKRPVASINMLPTDVLNTAIVRDVPFLSKIVHATIIIMGGPYVVYPNFTARRNIYVPWHTDTAFRKKNGGHQRSPEFVQCAVYFQENDPKEGGGLEVVPGSHRRICQNGRYYVSAKVLNVYGERVRVPSRAGDLVLFDGRLLHGSTGVDTHAPDPPKYGVFWTISRGNDRRHSFLAHLKDRRLNRVGDEGRLVEDPRFADIWNLEYPGSYPPCAKAAVDAGMLSIATMAELTSA